MRRYKLPIQFDDGKTMYSAVLAMINKTAPTLAKMIHEVPTYIPFSLELPDIVNVVDPTLEVISASWGLEEVKSLNHLDCFDGPINESLSLEFKHTYFRKGGISYPLPDPWMIIKNWKDRWNSIFSERISLDIPIYGSRKKENDMEIQFANLRIQQVRIENYRPMAACSGRLRMAWKGDKQGLRNVWALARFSEYAGTGAKTSMGCGVTRIESRREREIQAP